MTLREEALRTAAQYDELCPADSSPVEKAESLILHAKACYWSDDQKGAVKYQRLALDILEKARKSGLFSESDQRKFNKAYTIWAFRYAQNTCRWQQAYRIFEEAYRRALGWADPALVSEALILYAEAKMFHGDWPGCEKLAWECAQTELSMENGPRSDYPFWIWGRALV